MCLTLICFSLKTTLANSLYCCTIAGCFRHLRNTEHGIIKSSNYKMPWEEDPCFSSDEKPQQNDFFSFSFSVNESTHLTLLLPPIHSLHIFLETPPFIHLQLHGLQTPSSVRCRRLGCRPPPWHTHDDAWPCLHSGHTQSYITHVCETATLSPSLSGYAPSARQRSHSSHWTQQRNPDWNAARCSNWAADWDRNNGGNEQDGLPALSLLEYFNILENCVLSAKFKTNSV